MDGFIICIEFAVALFIIGLAGTRLAHYGDALGEHTGLGGSWIGLMLLATVTSLPELITGVSAIALANAPDIAVGTLLGSCVFNISILAILDFMVGGRTLYARLGSSHMLTVMFASALLLFIIVAISVSATPFGTWLSLGRIGITTPVVFLMYVLWTRMAYAVERTTSPSKSRHDRDIATLRQATRGYAISAVAVVATGLWLPFVGERISEVMNLNETFVGSLLIALVTSLPELVVTIAAVRMLAFDMAVSNLLGSNLFNLLILVPEDLLYGSGPLLAAVSPFQAISAVSALVMTCVAALGFARPPKRRVFGRLTWVGVVLGAIYLTNYTVLYLAGG